MTAPVAQGKIRISEAAWQAQVIDLAWLYRWDHLHIYPSTIGTNERRRHVTTTNIKGWPDLLLWSPRHRSRHIAAELKTDTGRVTPDQRAVLDDLTAAGFETHIWRPSDFSQVQELLR